MRDITFLKTLVRARAAISLAYGTKVCKEIAIGCSNCEAQITVGYLQNMIDTLEWSLKKK